MISQFLEVPKINPLIGREAVWWLLMKFSDAALCQVCVITTSSALSQREITHNVCFLSIVYYLFVFSFVSNQLHNYILSSRH